MDKAQLQQLLDKYLKGILTEQEFERLKQQHDHLDMEEVLATLLPTSFGSFKKEAADLSDSEKELLARIFKAGAQPAPLIEMVPHTKNRWLVRVAVAAAIVILLAGTSFFLLRGNNSQSKNMAGLPQAERFKNDIAPATEGVVLTMASGQSIRLDSAGNVRLLTDGHVHVRNGEGRLRYAASENEVFYHTVSTNKGMDYQLTLADGSKVWLDAVSSIHFPTAFPGRERVVEITGQAYFEVAKDPSKPFKVKAGGQTIEVLGTHFNANTYDNEDIKVTLLEGSVKVRSDGGQKSEKIIKPGEQAVVSRNLSKTTIHVPDLDEVMAWKNGQFYFDGSTIEDIMKQLSRWYDMDVLYQGRVNEVFVVDVPRRMPVSGILSLLEKTKQVEFVIDGNKVMVMEAKK